VGAGADDRDAIGDADVLTTGSSGWRDRWRLTSRPRRVALGGSAALVIAAVAIGAQAARASPAHRITAVVDPGPAPAAIVDATGCPATSRCDVSATAPDSLRTAFLRAFPAATVVAGTRTTDARRPGRSYRDTLVGTLASGALVMASSQCVPQGGPVAEVTVRSADTSLDLAGNTVVHSRLLSIVVPGADGCSVHVYQRSPGAGPLTEGPAIALAHDPRAQVSP
jgi:hypothetical protein